MIIQVKVKEVLEGEKGGPGSGNFNHKGIPGSVGGSAPGGGMSPAEAVASPELTAKWVSKFKPAAGGGSEFDEFTSAIDRPSGRSRAHVYDVGKGRYTAEVETVSVKPGHEELAPEVGTRTKLGTFDSPVRAMVEVERQLGLSPKTVAHASKPEITRQLATLKKVEVTSIAKVKTARKTISAILKNPNTTPKQREQAEKYSKLLERYENAYR